MQVTIGPSRIKGRIQAPPSKSAMQRACAAALIRKGESVIQNPGNSDDDRAALEIIRQLGAGIEKKEGDWKLRGGHVNPITSSVDCGESGLSIRLFTAIASLSDKQVTITGRGSLRDRPMDLFDRVLPQLGVSIRSEDGKLPLQIKGPLKPASIELDGSLSSQFLSGLLMAYAAADASDVVLTVKNLASRPYIDLTLDVMSRFGLKLPENRNYQEFIFHSRSYQATGSVSVPPESSIVYYSVEGDWSGAAFLLVAGAIAGPIQVCGLDLGSTQGDKSIIEAMMSANAGIAIEAKGIKVHPAEMNGFSFDASDCPDLFPPLVALAAYCKGETRIKGLERLVHKESNRALSLREEMSKMGLSIDLIDDWMIIHGGQELRGAPVHSHHDHRIAMACAVAALGAAEKTIIAEAGAVSKSYPGFFRDLKSLGADVSLPGLPTNP